MSDPDTRVSAKTRQKLREVWGDDYEPVSEDQLEEWVEEAPTPQELEESEADGGSDVYDPSAD